MAENKKKTLRDFTQQKFQEEVARELGIDLSQADQVRPATETRTHDADDEDLPQE